MTIILGDIEHFKPFSKVSNLKYLHAGLANTTEENTPV